MITRNTGASERRTMARGWMAGATALLAASMLTGLPAQAKRDGGTRSRKLVALVATPAGLQAGLKGKVQIDIEADRNREKLQFEVESNAAPAGSRLDAYALNPVNSANPVFLGPLTLQANPARPGEVQGSLELRNYDGLSLPTGLSPVAGITGLWATPAGDPATILLQAGSTPASGASRGGPGGGGSGEVRQRILMTATAPGVAGRVRGNAEIRSRAGRESLKVRVEAKALPAGTVVEVHFSHSVNGGPFLAGSAALAAGPNSVGAELQFETDQAPFLPSGASPVTGITSVTVTRQDTGELLLTGTF